MHNTTELRTQASKQVPDAFLRERPRYPPRRATQTEFEALRINFELLNDCITQQLLTDSQLNASQYRILQQWSESIAPIRERIDAIEQQKSEVFQRKLNAQFWRNVGLAVGAAIFTFAGCWGISNAVNEHHYRQSLERIQQLYGR